MKTNRVWNRSRLALLLVVCAGELGHIDAALAEAVPAKTQEIPNVPDSTERKILEHIKETNLTRLKGWPGMIFYCPTDEAKTSALRQICIESYRNLEALAAQYGVKFHKARNANDVAVLPHLTGRLKLLIELSGTEPDTQPSRHCRQSLSACPLRPSDKPLLRTEFSRLDECSSQTKHPLLVPQHVDAILWEGSLIKAASGGEESLVRPVVDAINENLKAFFADYAKANQ